MLEGTQAIPSPNPLAVGLPSPASWRHPVLPLSLPTGHHFWAPSGAPCAALGLLQELPPPPRQLAGDQAGGGATQRLQEGERKREKGRGREEKRGGRKAGPRSSLPAPLRPSRRSGAVKRKHARTHTREYIHSGSLRRARTAPQADQSGGCLSGLLDARVPGSSRGRCDFACPHSYPSVPPGRLLPPPLPRPPPGEELAGRASPRSSLVAPEVPPSQILSWPYPCS